MPTCIYIIGVQGRGAAGGAVSGQRPAGGRVDGAGAGGDDDARGPCRGVCADWADAAGPGGQWDQWGAAGGAVLPESACPVLVVETCRGSIDRSINR